MTANIHSWRKIYIALNYYFLIYILETFYVYKAGYKLGINNHFINFALLDNMSYYTTLCSRVSHSNNTEGKRGALKCFDCNDSE